MNEVKTCDNIKVLSLKLSEHTLKSLFKRNEIFNEFIPDNISIDNIPIYFLINVNYYVNYI